MRCQRVQNPLTLVIHHNKTHTFLCRLLILLMINKNSIEHDLLTGLYSRWKMRVALEEIIEADVNRVLVHLDVDNFKHINEKYGNDKGDAALIAISKALIKTYPDMLIGRLSSDEFAIIIDASRYSRVDMNQQTRTLFKNLHEIHVDGMEGYRFSFSISAIFIDPKHHTHPDIIIREANELHQISKKHEGNYLSSRNGMIPDVEGAFRILREDRKLYNEINNHLFDTLNEESWLTNLQNGARKKEQMFIRNQSQLEDIYSYYRNSNLPEEEYKLLFFEIMTDADSLDAFMRCSLIETILLPYYESCDRTNDHVRSYLGHLYLLMAHSLISVVRMGDDTQKPRVNDFLLKAYNICKDFPHNTIQFEPAFYALCSIVGHYESVCMELFAKEECDHYYTLLRELVVGPDPFVIPENKVFNFFDTVVKNAYLYPIFRVCHLKMKGEQNTDDEEAEMTERIEFIRQHQSDGCYDMVLNDPELSSLAVYLQQMILVERTNDEILDQLLNGLHQIHHSEYGKLSESNLIVVSYLFLGTSKLLLKTSLPDEEKHRICCKGLNFLVDILRSRESIASDHQLLLLVRIMINSMMSTPVLSSLDKVYYMEQVLAAISLDTYSHSMAVANYAKVILTNIIENYPQLLVGNDRVYETIEEVKANREQLLEFMDYVCRLHDIGKLSLVPITSNAFRRLTDQEFALIKKHCGLGRQILSFDASFALFEPIVYHHHRWYNEDGGYPVMPDNERNYRLKIFTDILTICDSIEAATSRVGRNYRRAKSFLQIMDELISESGMRYSHEIIDSITGCRQVYLKIRSMVDVKWEVLYKAIFQSVVLNRGDHYEHKQGQLPDIYSNSEHRVEDKSLSSQQEGFVMPGFLKQMSQQSRDLLFLSMMYLNRQIVTQNKSLIFFYDVEKDIMDYVATGPDGEFRHSFATDYSHNPQKEYLSIDGFQKAMSIIKKVVEDPDYPKVGQETIENVDKSKCLQANYTSVCDVNGNVKSVIGHLEDINTTKEKLLSTIDRQNRYGKITDSLGKMFEIVASSDIELTQLEFIKASPELRRKVGNMTSTKEFIQFTLDNLVDPSYMDEFKEFIDFSTLEERLHSQPFVSFEYKSRLSGWLVARIIPVAYDKQGHISHFLFAAENAEVAHKEKEQLTVLAKNDGLTGLLNRFYGEKTIREEMAKGGEQIFGILDCDHFKRINDYLSHLVGDEVLREQSKVMQQVFTGFHIMRLGGDEFVVYANGEVAHRLIYSYDGISKIFQGFASQISEIRIAELENIAPTMSCGVVFCSVPLHASFEDFYAMADSALKESKKKRDGCITIHEMG